MSSIRILPDSLVNKIAAGEVVERPASVVKELLENALDAGADRIRIEVENGGRTRIIVEDNGSGMDGDDILQALERHATSKISSDSDLASIATLGFRGEALPSIASVSRLTLSSRKKGTPDGRCVKIAGGKYLNSSPCGLFEGTRVEVERLFYNVPARRKFLRSPETELTHIVTLVENYAISRPDIAWYLASNGREVINLPAVEDRKSRFFDLFPDFPHEDFKEISLDSKGLSVTGLAAIPARNLSTPRYQFILVNGRFVKDRLVKHAVMQAYENTHPKGRYPPLFISIELPLDKVDVNVHPAKMEVRFVNGHMVHESVSAAVKDALFPEKSVSEDGFPYRLQEVASGGVKGFPAYNPLLPEVSPAGYQEQIPIVTGPGNRLAVSDEKEFSPLRALAQWRNSFIICDSPNGIAIVDQHVAHERLRFEQFKQFIGDPGARQPFLVPPVYELPRSHAHRSEEMAGLLTTQGFEADPLDGGKIAVRSAPAFLSDSEKDYLLSDFFESAGEVLKTPREKWNEVLIMRSCRGAVMANEPLPLEKLQYLLDSIHATGAPLTCPHGRPMVYILEDREIFSKFLR